MLRRPSTADHRSHSILPVPAPAPRIGTPWCTAAATPTPSTG